VSRAVARLLDLGSGIMKKAPSCKLQASSLTGPVGFDRIIKKEK